MSANSWGVARVRGDPARNVPWCICGKVGVSAGGEAPTSIAIFVGVVFDWMHAHAHRSALARTNPACRSSKRTCTLRRTRLRPSRALDQSLSFADDYEGEGSEDMEGATYPPPQAFAEKAHVKSKEQYDEMYRR